LLAEEHYFPVQKVLISHLEGLSITLDVEEQPHVLVLHVLPCQGPLGSGDGTEPHVSEAGGSL